VTDEILLASCTITNSPDVALRAARSAFWRKFRSWLGASYLSSFVILPGFIAFVVIADGANWIVGVLGALLFFNALIQFSSYVWIPRALARSASDPSRITTDLETTPEGIVLVSGRNKSFVPWTKFSNIWVYDDYIILVVGVPIASRFAYVSTNGMTPEVRSAFELAADGAAVT
jgi:hypothetical protein